MGIDKIIARVLDELDEGILAIDAAGRVVLCNAAAGRLIGFGERIMTDTMAERILPDMEMEAALSAGFSEPEQCRELLGRSVRVRRLTVFDEKKQIVGAVAILRDISEIREMTTQIADIQEMKLLLESIIDATQDAISVTDAAGNLTHINQAYTRVIGLTRDEVIGKPATIDISDEESMHLQVMKTLEPVCGVPLRVGPQRREVIVNAAPVLVHGQLKGSVIVAHDVSEIRRLTEELRLMKSLVRQIQSRYTFDDIIASSSAMRQTVELARKAASTPVTVLLSGESGTGKELFAHAIHHASQRKNAPFIRVNCAAIPDSLLESELFGYEEGSFTGARKSGKKGLFEEAGNGTVFLDEIGEITLPVQAKLLRVLQEKEITRVGGVRPIPVNIRVIAATNRDLEREVKQGRFREDLFYRINVFPIGIPPLRQRLSELPELTGHILRKLNIEYGRNVRGLSETAQEALSHYGWPGNVRELENLLARSMINMQPTEMLIKESHLPPLVQNLSAVVTVAAEAGVVAPPSLAQAVEQAERQAIHGALLATRYNKVAAARLLGISARSLYYKMEKYHEG